MEWIVIFLVDSVTHRLYNWGLMLIDDTVISDKHLVYSVDIMQIGKGNASLVRRSIASSFNFSQGPGRWRQKERDCLQSGIKSVGL